MVHIKVLVDGDEETNSRVLEVPDDVPAFRLLSTIVTKLQLPAKDPQGNLIDYTIAHNRTGRILKNSDTLSSVGVAEEDSVTLAPHIIMGGKPPRTEKQAPVVEPAPAPNGASGTAAEPAEAAAPPEHSLAATIARVLAAERGTALGDLPGGLALAQAGKAADAEAPTTTSQLAPYDPANPEAGLPPGLDTALADELDALSETLSEVEPEDSVVTSSTNGAQSATNGAQAAAPANGEETSLSAATIPLSLEELAGKLPTPTPAAQPAVFEQPEPEEARSLAERVEGRATRSAAPVDPEARWSTRSIEPAHGDELSARPAEQAAPTSTPVARPQRAAMALETQMETHSASRKLNGAVPADLVARLEEYRADENRWKALAWIFVGAIFGILLSVATADPFVTPSRVVVILLVISGLLAIIAWFAGRDYSKRAQRLKQSLGSGGSSEPAE